jgi:ABC-type multidrug transport system ATPase subunit
MDQRRRHRRVAGVPATRTDSDRTTALVIEFNNVGKTYKSLLGNSVKAVEEFSLKVVEGEILGIAGPNGAGKTTLIAMMLGYLRPTTGTVEIDGLPARQHIERNGIGYLSELIAINPKWRAETALVRFATLAGIARSEIPRRVAYVVDLLGLAEHRNKKVKALSKGNLQRLGLAQTLLRDDQILVLDEPTHGLDPVWTQRFREIVQDLRRPDRTILIASHNLDELQRLADRVAIIDRGRLQRVVSTSYESEAPATATRFRITLASGPELIRSAFPDAEDAGRGEFDVTVRSIKELNAALAELIRGGALVASVVPERSALEQQFREAVGESQ